LNRGAVVAILSMLFYFSSLLGGQAPQPVEPLVPAGQQQALEVLGRRAELALEALTVRAAPFAEAQALGVIKQDTEPVVILDRQDGWYRIRPSSGPVGWVPEYGLRLLKEAPKEGGPMLLGLYEPESPAYETLLQHSSHLTALAPLGWSLGSGGQITANFDPVDMGRSLYFAGNQELLTFGHIQVPASPTQLLASPQLKEQALRGLVQLTEEWGLKGLLVHLAYTPGPEQADLFAFLTALRGELAARGRRTLISLPWQEGLDYGAAGRGADFLLLHSSPGTQGPGPLAALPELEAMLEAVTQTVDPGKIILSLPTSGLDWTRTGTAQEISHGEALELAARHGAKIRWDASSMTPYFHYGNGREVWFENRYSLKYKLELVTKYRLGGAALSGLGQEDPAIWQGAAANLIG
jgi:hypothetical protein